MLSKSQARLFFVGGTVVFSLLFLWLTFDTVSKVPEQTNDQNITDAVRRGKILWEDNNCMGCHTILGEGAYYAPELTKAVERRGVEWLRVFLKDPQAMFPGERKMVQYDFTDEEINDVIAFLQWIGEMDLNGFPPRPSEDLQAGVPAGSAGGTAQLAHQAPVKYTQLCTACHALGGSGGTIGPALDGVGTKYDEHYLRRWISDPQAVKPGTAMPKLPLSEAEMNDIVQFLHTLQ